MGVAGLVYGTSSNAFYNVNADLTSPTDFDYAYEYYNDGFYLTQFDGQDYLFAEPVLYTRTADSTYFNYTTIVNGGDGLFDFVPEGLDITMTFNRSNTSWEFITGEGYFSDDTKIGSNNSVGTIAQKTSIQFDNQTPNNYYVYLDHSSTGNNGRPWTLEINDLNIITWDGLGVAHTTNIFMRLYLPSFTKLEFFSSSNSNAIYFDAWYLEDLGISDSYDNGYQDGYIVGEEDGFDDGYDEGLDDGVNQSGLFEIISATFSGLSDFLSVAIFGGITFGTLVLFPLMFGILFFILRVIRGQ